VAPQSHDSPTCYETSPVLFMEDRSTVCTRWADDCTEGNAAAFISGFRVLAQPFSVNASVVNVDSNLLLPDSRVAGLQCLDYVTRTTVQIGYNESSGLVTSVKFAFEFSTINLGSAVEITSNIVFSNGRNGTSVERSGMPGYIPGLPVITKPAVLLPDFNCARTINPTFGEDLSSGCTLRYTRDELENNCEMIRKNIFNQFKIELATVSMFGDGLDEVAVFQGKGAFNTSEASSFYQSQPVCTNVLIESKLEILWSDFGSITDPQPGIIAARVVYTGGNLLIECEKPSDCTNPGAKKFPFRIKSSVEFFKITYGSVAMFVPPPPRLIPPIPNDVFYPFEL